MANSSKPPSGADRRATLEALRKEQSRSDRRGASLVVGVAGVVAVGLVAAVVVPKVIENINDPAEKPLSAFGVPAGEAGCGEILTDDASGAGVHVPETETVEYATVPPSFGAHFDLPAQIAGERAFYTAEDRPPMERLVHNLEHGYNVVWYDPEISDEQLSELRDVAAAGRAPDKGRVIVTAYNDAYGELPEGIQVAWSHWTAEDGGKRQLCEQFSGAVLEDFVEQFPWSDAPEAGAA